MKLLGRTKSKINNEEKVKNVAHLEITEIWSTTIISKILESCVDLFVINNLVNC